MKNFIKPDLLVLIQGNHIKIFMILPNVRRSIPSITKQREFQYDVAVFFSFTFLLKKISLLLSRI
jgi:hypothetical protein